MRSLAASILNWVIVTPSTLSGCRAPCIVSFSLCASANFDHSANDFARLAVQQFCAQLLTVHLFRVPANGRQCSQAKIGSKSESYFKWRCCVHCALRPPSPQAHHHQWRQWAISRHVLSSSVPFPLSIFQCVCSVLFWQRQYSMMECSGIDRQCEGALHLLMVRRQWRICMVPSACASECERQHTHTVSTR